MTRFLASVNTLDEAHLVATAGADIIDLKQPAQGALGALPPDQVAEIVVALKPQAILSATIGDLDFLPHCVLPAVERMLATGVDYVKIGVFPGGEFQATLAALQAHTGQDKRLIAVLFADAAPDLECLPALAQAGFAGVMLDTMDKAAGRLTEHLPCQQLQRFCQSSRALGLLSGLAGSLRSEDIAVLRPLSADYLGFRGALCHQQQRTATLDSQRVRQIRQLLEA